MTKIANCVKCEIAIAAGASISLPPFSDTLTLHSLPSATPWPGVAEMVDLSCHMLSLLLLAYNSC